MTQWNEKMKSLLELHEGTRDKVYDDATGQTIRPRTKVHGWPTIGIGRNLVTNPLRPHEIDYLFRSDLEAVLAMCNLTFTWFKRLDGVRRAVVVDMVYGMGLGGFQTFENTIGFLEAGEYFAASREMLDSVWARGPHKGRAQRLSKMMETGEWP